MQEREQQGRVEDEEEAKVERTTEMKDLEVDPDEAASVTGGRLVDPCEGGEYTNR